MVHLPKKGIANIRVPNIIKDGEVCRVLKECWEETRNIKVPQYRDGDDWDGKNHPRQNIRLAKQAEFEQQRAEFEHRPAGQKSQAEMKKETAGAGQVERGAGQEAAVGGASGERGKSGGEFIYNPRPIWDACVARVMRGHPLFCWRRLNALRKLLHREPHVRGKSYHESMDAKEE